MAKTKANASERNNPRPKLTRAERRQLAAVMKRIKKDGLPHSAQDTIPYRCMWQDGLCQVDETTYTKTIRFYDINYQLAHADEQDRTWSDWGDFLNSFDSNVSVQISCVNMVGDMEDYERAVTVPRQADAYDHARSEYEQMLKSQLDRGSRGLTKSNYVTLTIKADSAKVAKAKLNRAEVGVLNNFKRMNVPAAAMNGKERLRLLHDMMHMDKTSPFEFDWRWLPATGMSTKDFIAPSSFDFSQTRMMGMGGKVAAVSYCEITGAELKDRVLANLMAMESGMVISMHIHPLDQHKAIQEIKRKVTDINSMKIDEQIRAVRTGYDMDILPSDLNTYGGSAEKTLKDLEGSNERMFTGTFLVMHIASTKKQLMLDVAQAQSIAQQDGCKLVPLDFVQEDGFVSSLPLGVNKVNVNRALTTSSLSILIPFTSQELFQTGDEALYYGINALSGNLIMLDRKLLPTPNGVVLGKPGAGKSFFTKEEFLGIIMKLTDCVILCDPENEYGSLVLSLGGQVIRISAVSKDYINPLDLDLAAADDKSALDIKADFIYSMMEIMVGGKSGLQAGDWSIIDKAIQKIYLPYIQNPKPENMPILGDLQAALMEQDTSRAKELAMIMEVYVSGSMRVFNHRTNVDTKNRVVCYDLKSLGDNLKRLGMLIVQDQVWARVVQNRAAGITTRYYVDEFHLMLRDEQTAKYSVDIWKRFRKWGGIPTAITQNVSDFLTGHGAMSILENSDFICMLNQGAEDRRVLAQKLNISEQQQRYITNSPVGEGLIFYGDVIIPFKGSFPKDTELYRLMTTRPNEKFDTD